MMSVNNILAQWEGEDYADHEYVISVDEAENIIPDDAWSYRISEKLDDGTYITIREYGDLSNYDDLNNGLYS